MKRSEIEVKDSSRGVFLNVPPIRIPAGGMTACRNVRIRNGRVRNENMGWVKFTQQTLNGVVNGIFNFDDRSGVQHLVFCTPTDLYEYIETDDTVRFITPQYNVGDLTATSASPTLTGNGTLWNTIASGQLRKNVLPGDKVYIGTAGYQATSGTWYTVQAVGSDTSITLTGNFSGSTGGGKAYTIRRLMAGSALNEWTGEFFPAADTVGDILIITNGIDKPHYWTGENTTKFIPMDGVQFTCRALRVFKNIMLYGDITEGGTHSPSTVATSAVGDPRNVTNLEATRLDWGDGISPLHAFEILGDQVVAYGKRFVSLVQFVGDPVYWVIRSVGNGIGSMSRRGIMNFGYYHSFVSNDGGYHYDGARVFEYGSHVFQDAIRKISPTRFSQLLAHIDEENGDVLWLIPQNDDTVSGYPNTAYCEHYLESDRTQNLPVPFTIRDFPATSTGYFQRKSTLRFSDLPRPWSAYNFRWSDQFWQANFPFNLFGTKDGTVMIFGVADDANGAAISSYARFGRISPGRFGAKRVVARVEPYAMQRHGYALSVLLWGADSADGPLSLMSQIDFDLDGENRFVSPRKSIRYGEVEFATNAVNRPWDISGFRVDLIDAGMR